MVAYDSTGMPDPARSLSVATVEQLRRAIAAYWRAASGGDLVDAAGPDATALAAGIREAAREARERGLQPEGLIVLLKRIDAEVAFPEGRETPTARRHFREWLVSTCLAAYFTRDPS